MSDKQTLLKHRDANTPKPVKLPDGDVMHVKTMTSIEREKWEEYAWNDDGSRTENWRATLLAFTVCDESGKLLFAPEEIASIAAVPAPVVVLLFNVANDINSLVKVEEAAKKS